MLIALAAPEYDLSGSGLVRVNPESINETYGGQRRQTRTATLDGGTSLYDTGFTVADNTWEIRIPWSATAEALVSRLSSLYQYTYISVPAGFYKISLQAWRMRPGEIVATIAVMENIA